MADLSKIKLNGTEYDLKDAVARAQMYPIIGSTDSEDIDFPFISPAEVITAILQRKDVCVIHHDNTFNITFQVSDWKINTFGNNSTIAFASTIAYLNSVWYVYQLYGSGNTWQVLYTSLAEQNDIPTSDITANTNARHTHSNKALLDTYTQTEANLADAISKKHTHSNKNALDDITAEKISAWDNGVINHADKTDLPLIVTGTCAFGSSLLSGIDSPIAVTNVSHTVTQIATAVSNNRPVEMVLNNNGMKINLKLTAFDGSIYYFTNSYDPFNGDIDIDNESFNITVKAQNENDVDSFTYFITYNKNAFATKSEVTAQISTAVGNLTEFDTQVVETLPATGVKGTIYFTPNNHGTNDIYDEFIYVNNAWEKVGNTQVDLTGYVHSNDLANVALTGSYNNLVDTPDIPTKTSDLTNDSNFITLADVPTELPVVTTTDNNKALGVVNGTWGKMDIFDGNYNSLTNKPTLFSGSYNDLTDKPTIPSATTVTQTITSGVKIAEINGTAIYAPSYANGDQISY